jgi:hypothetical protein
MYKACKTGNTDQVKFLIRQGADNNLEGAFYFAMMFYKFKTARYLLTHKIDFDVLDAKPIIELYSRDGSIKKLKVAKSMGIELKKYPHAIYDAVSESHLDVVKFLISEGCDPLDSGLIFQTCCFNGDIPMFKFFIEELHYPIDYDTNCAIRFAWEHRNKTFLLFLINDMHVDPDVLIGCKCYLNPDAKYPTILEYKTKYDIDKI